MLNIRLREKAKPREKSREFNIAESNATKGDGKTSTHGVTQSVVNKLMKVLDRTIETYRKQARKEVQKQL